MELQNDQKKDKNVVGILLSNFPALVQLAVVLSIGLTTSIGLSNLFYFEKLLTLINFLAFLITTSSIAYYSYLRKNKTLTSNFSNPESSTKTFMSIIQIVELLFFIVFLLATIFVSQEIGNKLIWGILQAFFYPLLLLSIGITIFVWFQDIIEKQKYFKPEDLLPNLNIALRKHGLIQDRNEITLVQELQYGDKLFSVKSGDNDFYVITNFDATLVKRKLTNLEADSLINPQR